MKRAQITVYIIIGITLLLLIGAAMYITQSAWRPSAKILPADRPIKEYVESCMQQVTINALIPIGANGGYLDTLDPIKTNRVIEISFSPAEGDALLLSELAKQAVPFWFYMQTPNDCKQCQMSSQQPGLEEVRESIRQHVTENLEICINSFEPFLEQGYTFEAGEVETDVLFTEKDIRVMVNYPLTIRKLDIVTRIDRFETNVDISLKKMYELANEITKVEREKAILESIMFHFISLHTGLDLSKLPPLAAVTHDKVTVFWIKPLVQMNLQQLLLSYIPLIQLEKTKDAKQIITGDNPFETGFYKGLYLKVLDNEYPFKVNFAYLDWPVYFDITPRRGDILTGETHIQEFPFNSAPLFQTNYYEFYYDISAPVLVEIRDEDALKGKGYSFNFALELNIRDNKNFVEWNMGEGTIGVWDPDNAYVNYQETSRTTGDCAEQGDYWVCELSGRAYDDSVACAQACVDEETITKEFKPLKKLFADEEQKISDTVTVTILDAVTKEPVDKASLLYKCGKYATTIMGATGYKGKVKAKLPVCINGQLSAEKDGYAKKVTALTILPGDRKNTTIMLEPEAEVIATVKKHPVQITNIRELDAEIETEAEVSNSWSSIDSWEDLGMSAMGGFTNLLMPIQLDFNTEEKTYKVGRQQKKLKIYDRTCCSESEELNYNNKAVIMIEKVPETPIDPTYFKTLLFDHGETTGQTTLVPGQYKVNAMLIDAKGFVIEPGCQEICLEYDTDTEFYVKEAAKSLTDVVGVMPSSMPDCKTWGYFPEDPVIVKPAIRGGVNLDNDTGYWNVTRADLNKGGVEFYMIQTLKPTCTVMYECVLDICVDIAEMQATQAYSKQYREYLEPKFMAR